MPDPSLSMTLDDDLPRTVRRERDAREREAREREARDRAAREREALDRAPREASANLGPSFGPGPTSGLSAGMGPATASMAHPHAQSSGQAPQPMRMEHDDADLPAPPATVTAFDVPFLNLMFFFLKAVIAGIPALLLIGAILWGFGHVLQTFFPALLKLKIMIYVPPL